MISPLTRNALLTASVICLGSLTVNSAQADTNTAVRQTIQAAYDGMSTAAKRKDITALMLYFAPDYVGIDAKGKQVTAVQARKYRTDILNNTKSFQVKTTVQSIELNSTKATVLAKQHLEAIMETSKVIADSTSRDLWINTEQGWRLKQSQTLSNQTTVNGKPVSVR